jgi:hypothetical protein
LWQQSTVSGLLGEPGIRFGIANAALILAVATCAWLGVGTSWALLLLAAVVIVTASGTTFAVGGAIGLVAWAFQTGFLENTYGLLTFNAADLTHLCLLTVVGAMTASGVTSPHPATPTTPTSGGNPWPIWSSSQ